VNELALEIEKVEKTTVALSVEVKKRLDVLGNKADTYDDIVRRLLDQLDKLKIEKQ
jgi:hypothetical protein